MTLDNFDVPNDRVQEYRGFRLVHTDPFGHVHVELIGGGRVPQVLEGSWTGANEVMKKIDWYVGTKEQKESAPPQDNNTRKVQEILKSREETPVDAKDAISKSFGEAQVSTKKYVENAKKDK